LCCLLGCLWCTLLGLHLEPLAYKNSCPRCAIHTLICLFCMQVTGLFADLLPQQRVSVCCLSMMGVLSTKHAVQLPARGELAQLSQKTCVFGFTCATGLDYRRDIFGPCTAPGVPAATCRVSYHADITKDDGQLDDATDPHGTNVAGIIASTSSSCPVNKQILQQQPCLLACEFVLAMRLFRSSH